MRQLVLIDKEPLRSFPEGRYNNVLFQISKEIKLHNFLPDTALELMTLLINIHGRNDRIFKNPDRNFKALVFLLLFLR